VVQEQHLGLAEQRERQVQPPPLAARQLLDPHAGLPVEADQGQHLVRRPGPADAARPHPRGLRDGQLGGEAALLEHHAGAGTYGGPFGEGVVPEDPDGAAGRAGQSLQQFHRRGLARPVGAQQREDFPAPDGKADSADRLEPVPVHTPQVSDLNHVFVCARIHVFSVPAPRARQQCALSSPGMTNVRRPPAEGRPRVHEKTPVR
jgi:hypothetical protein